MTKINDGKKYAISAGHFNDHAHVGVKYSTHCLMQHVQGYLRSHWTLPSGKYLHPIVPTATMVINFGMKNWQG
jgi:hypothetical protein